MTEPVRWDYAGESDSWVAWQGDVIVGRVARKTGREWSAWALGGKELDLPTLQRAQWWVEMWARELAS